MNLPPRRGLAITILGPILMLIVAPLTVGLGIWAGIALANHRIGSHPWVQPGQVLHLTGTQTQSILVRNDEEKFDDCTVHGPSGEVPISYSTAIRLNSYKENGTFEPKAPGDYRMDCTVKVKVMSVSARDDADDAFGVGLMAGFGGAAVVFVLGGVLLIVGITKLVNSGRERQQARLAVAGSFPQPPATYPRP